MKVVLHLEKRMSIREFSLSIYARGLVLFCGLCGGVKKPWGPQEARTSHVHVTSRNTYSIFIV